MGHGVVSASAFQAFFRVIAFSRLPEMFWEHGTASRWRGRFGSAMGARQRERAKARNRPARRSKGFVREWGTVSSRRLHFRPSFALSRFRDYPRCSGNTAQHRDGEAALVRRWERDSAKGRNREIDLGGEVRDSSGNGARCRLGVCISGLLSRYRVYPRCSGNMAQHRDGEAGLVRRWERERAKARNRPARRSTGFVREWGTVSSRRLHFRPSFALSRFRDYPRCSGNMAQHRDGEAGLVRRWERERAKTRNRPGRRTKGFVREWGTVSTRRLHFRPSFALSRFRDYPRCSGNMAQHRDGEAHLWSFPTPPLPARPEQSGPTGSSGRGAAI
jgi:hypothetical protein